MVNNFHRAVIFTVRELAYDEFFVNTEIFRENVRENFRETENFSPRLSRKRKFSRDEILRKFAYFRSIFAFRENEKNRFRFSPNLDPSCVRLWLAVMVQYIASHVAMRW
jgi:hypothetical protein